MTDKVRRSNDVAIDHMAAVMTELQKEAKNKIFSGSNSSQFWDEINKLCNKEGKNKKLAHRIGWALYSMGCRCQELETKVDNQAKEIETLKRRLGETPASSAPITDLGSLSC